MLCEKCGINEAQDDHLCPYSEDIDDDHDTECNCCEECEQNCADSI